MGRDLLDMVKINFIDGKALEFRKTELSIEESKEILKWFKNETTPIIKLTVGRLTHHLPRHAIYNITSELEI